VIVRLGGDEFAVILPTADADTAGTVTRALLEALNRRVPGANASIGVAGFDERGDALLRADLAMYEAKAAGGGCWVAAE
jgi:diguanylate cyclase (GGDEF)-like protein